MNALDIFNLVLIVLNIVFGIINTIRAKTNNEDNWLGWACSAGGWTVALLWLISVKFIH
jgi:hypothetical protein